MKQPILKKIINSIKNFFYVPVFQLQELSSVEINGKIFDGKRLNIIDGQLYIDGKIICKQTNIIYVIVNGNVEVVNAHVVEINGDVLGDVDSQMVHCHGSIEGDVDCQCLNCDENILGSVSAKEVECKQINGNVEATSLEIK